LLTVLKQRDLGLLFGGQVISQIGDFVLFVALPFWIYQLTGSATATGLMFAALTLPQLFLSPIAGVFVDRWDRRTTMIVADLLRAGIMLAYFTVRTADQAWIIYLLAFAESSVSRFFLPAVSAVVPMIAPRERLAQINAALGMSNAIARLGGPALGGILVAVWGPHSAAALDSVSYLISAAAITLMRIPATACAPTAENGRSDALYSVGRQLVEGLQVVLGRPVLRMVFSSVTVFMLSEGIIDVLLVVMVTKVWRGGASELGWLISAQGVGALVGSAVIGSVSARISSRMLIVAGGMGIGGLLLAMVNQPSVYVAMALLTAGGVMVVAVDVGWTTLMQLGSDDSNRGRVAVLLQTVIATAMMLSIGITSAVADQVGVVGMLDAAAMALATHCHRAYLLI
jgi:MFS family permease